MSWLTLLLLVKITVTSVVVVLPFLLLPVARLNAIADVEAARPTLFRLYGVAVTALLVGYGFGAWSAENGQFPWGVTCMGLVSNGGACALLFSARANRNNNVLASLFFLIAIGLMIAMLMPEQALQKAW